DASGRFRLKTPADAPIVVYPPGSDPPRKAVTPAAIQEIRQDLGIAAAPVACPEPAPALPGPSMAASI
ncbi:MAG: hypothetical protein LBK95_18995, partial [Bifidobacteriaceae bacterium]|nr:hypothetical protein [Bifidobacteriaceae bacterium]